LTEAESSYSDGTQLTAASFAIRIAHPWRILMRSKLAISALVVASLFGTSVMASAQTQPAPGASSEGNVGPGASKSGMKSQDGMTTGAGTNSGVAGANKSDSRSPSSQGNVGPGTDNNAGRK
jgi:hypothetical protein